MSELLKQILISIILLCVFCVLYSAKRNIFPASIVFYESIFLTGLFIAVVYVLASKVNVFINSKSIKPALYASFLLIILFNAIVPTTLDRSVSAAVIGRLANSEDGLYMRDLEKQFSTVFIEEGQAVVVRVREQIASGNVIQDINGKYRLTKRGKFTVSTIRFFSKLFNLNMVFFMDQ